MRTERKLTGGPNHGIGCVTPAHSLPGAVAALLLLAALSSCGSDRLVGPVTGIGVEEIDAFAQSFVQEWDILGAQFAVAREGKLVVATAYGFVDRARSDTLGLENVFRVASVSKPITGVAVMKAFDDGLLALDAKVFVELLADLVPPEGPADPRLRDITVDHLLHHAGGFDQVGDTELLLRTKEVAEVMGVANPPDSDAIVGFVTRQPLGFSPGSDTRYTNVSYVTLGRVLERVSGQSYEAFVREHVFLPMGLTRPRLGGPLLEDRLPGEVEYDSRGERWPSIFDGQTTADAPYGGLHLAGFDAASAWVMSAVDLARMGLSVDGRPGVPDLLSPTAHSIMLTDGAPGSPSYGAGWALVSADVAASLGLDRVAFWEHTGAMPGTTSYLAVREDGVTLAVVMNQVDGDFLTDLARGFHRAVADVRTWPDRDLFARYLP